MRKHIFVPRQLGWAGPSGGTTESPQGNTPVTKAALLQEVQEAVQIHPLSKSGEARLSTSRASDNEEVIAGELAFRD